MSSKITKKLPVSGLLITMIIQHGLKKKGHHTPMKEDDCTNRGIRRIVKERGQLDGMLINFYGENAALII